MSRNNVYTKEDLLDYLSHQKYYKLTGTDLSIQINTSIPQQLNFQETRRSDGTQCFLMPKSSIKLF